MRDQELAGDVAGPDSHQSQLHDPSPHVVRQRPPVDKDPAQLVDPAVTCSLQSNQEPRAGVKLGDKMAKFPQ